MVNLLEGSRQIHIAKGRITPLLSPVCYGSHPTSHMVLCFIPCQFFFSACLVPKASLFLHFCLVRPPLSFSWTSSLPSSTIGCPPKCSLSYAISVSPDNMPKPPPSSLLYDDVMVSRWWCSAVLPFGGVPCLWSSVPASISCISFSGMHEVWNPDSLWLSLWVTL